MSTETEFYVEILMLSLFWFWFLTNVVVFFLKVGHDKNKDKIGQNRKSKTLGIPANSKRSTSSSYSQSNHSQVVTKWIDVSLYYLKLLYMFVSAPKPPFHVFWSTVTGRTKFSNWCRRGLRDLQSPRHHRSINHLLS